MSVSVRIPTDAEIQPAVSQLAQPNAQYAWLVQRVREIDVRTDAAFQRRYNHVWRVRKNAAWREAYDDLLERSKASELDYASTLRTLHERTGTVEASFTSKLLATLDPTRPVNRIDAAEAAGRLDELLDGVANGESFVLTRAGRPSDQPSSVRTDQGERKEA